MSNITTLRLDCDKTRSLSIRYGVGYGVRLIMKKRRKACSSVVQVDASHDTIREAIHVLTTSTAATCGHDPLESLKDAVSAHRSVIDYQELFPVCSTGRKNFV